MLGKQQEQMSLLTGYLSYEMSLLTHNGAMGKIPTPYSL